MVGHEEEQIKNELEEVMEKRMRKYMKMMYNPKGGGGGGCGCKYNDLHFIKRNNFIINIK